MIAAVGANQILRFGGVDQIRTTVFTLEMRLGDDMIGDFVLIRLARVNDRRKFLVFA